eukprot:9486754-Karenia_brevis.AAC.1
MIMTMMMMIIITIIIIIMIIIIIISMGTRSVNERRPCPLPMSPCALAASGGYVDLDFTYGQ